MKLDAKILQPRSAELEISAQAAEIAGLHEVIKTKDREIELLKRCLYGHSRPTLEQPLPSNLIRQP